MKLPVNLVRQSTLAALPSIHGTWLPLLNRLPNTSSRLGVLNSKNVPASACLCCVSVTAALY